MGDNLGATAELLNKAIDISGKSQKQIAIEAGFSKPNIITMMKKGATKIPIDRIPAVAKACNVDPAHMMRVALKEYHPEMLEVIEANLGAMLSAEERDMIEAHRKSLSTE